MIEMDLLHGFNMVIDFKIDKSELIKIAQSTKFTSLDLGKLARDSENDIFFENKEKLAKSQLLLFRLDVFWEIISFLLKGEIETKKIVKKYIDNKKAIRERLAIVVYGKDKGIRKEENIKNKILNNI